MLTSKRWSYFSENLGGNLHEVASYIDEYHPEWDVVAMDFTGSGTVVVYRLLRGTMENLRACEARDKRRNRTRNPS